MVNQKQPFHQKNISGFNRRTYYTHVENKDSSELDLENGLSQETSTEGSNETNTPSSH